MADIRKNGKQYGLICPKKAPLSAPKAINVFGADDDSDVDDGTDWVKKALKAEGEKHKVKKQTRLDMQKALDEDPTIYQYDEVFDDMKQTEEQGKAIKKEAKKSKYIGNLLKTADRRKREQEHRIERMVQKEREAEGAMYADKESFVTSAYKAKLEELKKMEEEEQNMDRLEAIGDVTKQPDMGGFYRHFFHQTVDAPKPVESEEPTSTKKQSEIENNSRKDADKFNIDRDDVLPSTSGSEKNSDSEDESRSKKSKNSRENAAKGKRSRQYRKRVVEASESESEADEIQNSEVKATNEEIPIEEKRTNDENSEPAKKKTKTSEDDKQLSKNDKIIKEKSADCVKQPVADDRSPVNNKINDIEKTETADKDVKVEEEKIKVSIWEKRTVGPIFDAALQRYYIRKANRLSGS